MEDPQTFDERVALYKSDPEAFECYRMRTLNAAIEKRASEVGGERGEEIRRSLNGMVWRLNVLRLRYKDPVAWNAKLHELLMLKLNELNTKLKELVK